MTMELIQDMAEERGIDLSAIDREVDDEQMINRNKAKSDLLSHISKNYINSVDEWFDSNSDSLKIREGYEGFEGVRLKIFYE